MRKILHAAGTALGKMLGRMRGVLAGTRDAGTRAKTEKRLRGDAGERLAAEFLRKQCGMKILYRNFRAGRDEIDIIARDGNTLVFAEVKTRSERDTHGAIYAVDARKRRALHRAAAAYMRLLRERPSETRLDAVEVYLPDERDAGTRRAGAVPPDSHFIGEARLVHHRALSWNPRRRRD